MKSAYYEPFYADPIAKTFENPRLDIADRGADRGPRRRGGHRIQIASCSPGDATYCYAIAINAKERRSPRMQTDEHG
jgi:hypothetical protein